MGMCEQELLAYKLKELFCKKSCCDCCDICVVDCCKDKDCKDKKSCDYCDCCVEPMEYLLKQFQYGDTIYLLTDDGYFYDGWTFLAINNNILTVTPWIGCGWVEKISVCKIESIDLPPEGQTIGDIEFLDNKCKSDKGYCKCCEYPFRNQLESCIGTYVYICTNLGYAVDNHYEGYVYSVSDGIVVLDYDGIYTAISTCKIISVGLSQYMLDGGVVAEELVKRVPKLANKKINPIQERKTKK